MMLALWLGTMAPAQALGVTARDGFVQPLVLADDIQLLRGHSEAWPANEVLAGKHDAAFVRSDGNALHCADGTVCWVRFDVSRAQDAPTPWWLRIRALRPGDVTLHAHTPTGEVAMQSGRQFPLSWRFVSTDLFFKLDVGTQPTRYYVRLANTPGADGFSLWQEHAFETEQRRLNTYLNASMGVAFALLMVNVVFWLWLRDALFLHFAFVMLVAVLLHAWQTWPALAVDAPMGDLDARGALQCLLRAATATFAARLFDFRIHLPWAARAADAYAGLNFALAAFVAIFGHHAAIEPWTALLEVLLLSASLGLTGWLIFGRHQWQYAWPATLMLTLSFSSMIGRLRWLGWMEMGPDVALDATWAAARLFYMLLLAVLVADRTRRAELELRQRRRRALEDAREAERMLEDKVRQRTRELGESNRLLAGEIERRREAETGLQVALASERKTLGRQRQFVSLVSHEFRTPLAVIDAAAQSINLPGIDPQPRALRIRRAVHRLTLLVNNCLADERLRADRGHPRSEAIDLRALLDGLVQACGPAERARVRLALPDAVVPVRGDHALLEIALHNLLQNALKYSPTERAVELVLAVHGQEARVTVADQGDGIAAEEQGRIFERFFRGAASPRSSGTGLGLFLCEEIARTHGGAVVLLRSDADGSAFEFRMPLESAAPPPQDGAAPPSFNFELRSNNA